MMALTLISGLVGVLRETRDGLTRRKAARHGHGDEADQERQDAAGGW
ncbi:hypothetical protein Psi02_08090 [Planotetraspora silvatica]|uniref:Uncharacterized protein n=1 Tax=Planotetraspora silvatica TaxID=234614 RepID=A0A8J3UTK3_9ACTN|nr:hypothetical protein Psi02_08090 [Planotetraspora silvatica]